MEPSQYEEAQETNAPPRRDSGLLKHNNADTNTPWTPSTVLHQIPNHQVPSTGSSSPVQFFHLLERLKTTKREGWRRFNIAHGESIADHMYRMSIITMLAPPSLSLRLDLAKCTRMALIHDMAESLVGDITPIDGVLKSEKSRRETATMDYVCRELLGNVDGGAQGQEMRKTWQEYEDSQTLESQFVHDVDKIELMLQMLEYERAAEGRLDLSEFLRVAQRIQLAEVREWCTTLLEERRVFWESMGKQPPGPSADSQREAQQDEYYGANDNAAKHGTASGA